MVLRTIVISLPLNQTGMKLLMLLFRMKSLACFCASDINFFLNEKEVVLDSTLVLFGSPFPVSAPIIVLVQCTSTYRTSCMGSSRDGMPMDANTVKRRIHTRLSNLTYPKPLKSKPVRSIITIHGTYIFLTHAFIEYVGMYVAPSMCTSAYV